MDKVVQGGFSLDFGEESTPVVVDQPLKVEVKPERKKKEKKKKEKQEPEKKERVDFEMLPRKVQKRLEKQKEKRSLLKQNK